MLKIGVTGNIGCGKSSFSNILKGYNIPIIDADIKGREIYNDKSLLEKVKNEFGYSVINKDGSLNRKKLGQIVFSDNEKLKILNGLTHPAIENLIKEDIEYYEQKGEKIVVLDAALLIEGMYHKILDKVIVITCCEDIQIKRIVSRDNCTEKEAIERIKSQMSQSEKIKYADFVVDNSKTIDYLEKEAKRILNILEMEFENKK